MQRACVIGMGPIGNNHATVYASLPNAELVGVCDRQPDRADAAARKYGVPAFYSAQEMLDALILSRRFKLWKRGLMCCVRSLFPMI